MIEYIKGSIAELTPTQVVLEAYGIGYAISLSLNTYSALEGKKDAKIYIHEIIREDAHLLFGFAHKQERELFVRLISVSGIGGNTARTILSTFSPQEFLEAINTGDAKAIQQVKGIGLKTAQRIIVDLKGKLNFADSSDGEAGNTSNSSIQTRDEAVSALTMLGFTSASSGKVVAAILKEDNTLKVEQVIKLALKRL